MKHDETQTPSELGLRPIRLRTRTAKVEEALNRRHVGLGSLFFSGEQALHGIQQVELAIEMLKVNDKLDGKGLVELRRLQLGFNRVLLESGKAYLASAKELEQQDHQLQIPTGGHVRAFPSSGNGRVLEGGFQG